jgi:lipase
VTRYGTRDVPVRGGLLRVGTWDSDDVADGATPTTVVLGVHGVTASHLSWQLVTQELTAVPGSRVIAADLRGRGRSADLPGPWGMTAHADDLAAVLDAFGVAHALVVGHSMGGFVSVVFAQRQASRVSALVLVDGGIPLAPIPGLTDDEALRATLGPAAERLAMTFETRQDYRNFWRKHPAFSTDWSEAVERYVDYDLVKGPTGLHSSARYEAVAADFTDLKDAAQVTAAWRELPVDPVFLRAPTGLLAQPPGLYPSEVVDAWAADHPQLSWHEVDGVNHYTIILGDAGARSVAAAVRSQLA